MFYSEKFSDSLGTCKQRELHVDRAHEHNTDTSAQVAIIHLLANS